MLTLTVSKLYSSVTKSALNKREYTHMVSLEESSHGITILRKCLHVGFPLHQEKIISISPTGNLLLFFQNSLLACIICMFECLPIQQKNNTFQEIALSSHFVRHQKYTEHGEKYQCIDRGEAVLLGFFQYTEITYFILKHRPWNIKTKI